MICDNARPCNTPAAPPCPHLPPLRSRVPGACPPSWCSASPPACRWRWPARPCRPGWRSTAWTSPRSVFSAWSACRIPSSSCGRRWWTASSRPGWGAGAAGWRWRSSRWRRCCGGWRACRRRPRRACSPSRRWRSPSSRPRRTWWWTPTAPTCCPRPSAGWAPRCMCSPTAWRW